VSSVQVDPTSPEQPSPAASRMRRSRARRQRGEAIVSLEIGPAVIANLISLGWLSESDHADKGAIAGAVADLVERAILARATPCADSEARTSFLCDVPAITADTLIGLR
jgi:hypothetical protein